MTTRRLVTFVTMTRESRSGKTECGSKGKRRDKEEAGMGRGQVCVCVKKSRNDRMGLSDGGRFTSPVKLLPAYLLCSAVCVVFFLLFFGVVGGVFCVFFFPYALF